MNSGRVIELLVVQNLFLDRAEDEYQFLLCHCLSKLGHLIQSSKALKGTVSNAIRAPPQQIGTLSVLNIYFNFPTTTGNLLIFHWNLRYPWLSSFTVSFASSPIHNKLILNKFAIRIDERLTDYFRVTSCSSFQWWLDVFK